MKYFFYITSVLIILTSCETVVELELPEKQPSLVVNCFFNPDSAWLVNVSKSQYVLDNAPIQKIGSAKVSIFEESIWIEDLSFVSEGYYSSSKNNKPQVGKKYKIHVSADGFNDAETNDAAPHPTEITGIDSGIFFMENQKYFELKIRFKDNPSEKNYYVMQVLKTFWFPEFDTAWNIIDSTLFTEAMYFQSRDIIFDHEQWFDISGAPFSDEIIGSKGEYQLSILFDEYSLSVQDSVGNSLGKIPELTILLKSVSESYYNYIASYKKYQQANGNPFAQPVQVYSNINNGYGIFAGYSPARFVYKLN